MVDLPAPREELPVAMRAFKYRLYPTAAQARELHAQINEACRLYNAALQERRDAWNKCGVRVTCYEQHRQLTEIRAAGDVAIPSCVVARDVLLRVDRAFRAFFRRVKAGQKPGYPRFRAARRYDSITWTQGEAPIVNGLVRLCGVGHVRVLLHRPAPENIKTTTVKREAGRWFVVVVAEVADESLTPIGASVGVDVGLATFATLSTGERVENPRHAAAASQKLRVACRSVARRTKGSQGRRKAVRLLQRALAHVRNQRRDFHHKVSRSLVNRFDLIAVEALNVKGLARAILAKSVHDAGWGQFLEMLTYKAESAGRQLIRVNPSGTSQRCAICGTEVRKTLAQRRHDCPACGVSLDRDHNAALNILGAGLALAAPTWAEVRPSVAAEVGRAHGPRSSSDTVFFRGRQG